MGTQFTANVVDKLLTLLQMDHTFSIPYKPSTNGLVERVNGEVGRHLRNVVQMATMKDNFGMFLPVVQRIINSVPHGVTGVAPGQLMFGTNWTGLQPMLKDMLPQSSTIGSHEDFADKLAVFIRDTVETVALGQVERPQEVTAISIGTLVLLDRQRKQKLDPLWAGPYRVMEVVSTKIYKLEHAVSKAIVPRAHIAQLKLFHNRDGVDLETIAASDGDEYVVEDIIDHAYVGKAKKKRLLRDYDFLVTWRGYGAEENRWLPYKEVKDVEAFRTYCQKIPELSLGEVV
jgi:hypothetical protein